MKSETYQKEGWFVLEEENSVFGGNAENNDNLDSEDIFDFYHKNKEIAKSDIDKAAKDFSDYMESVSEDAPGLSEEEISAGIEKILQRTHPAETESETVKTTKSKKVTFKVLFLVALLSVVCFSCLCAVGSSHNISIENGFISFAKETVQVVFFGDNEEKYISVDSLLLDLEEHGYDDILFPEEFIVNSDEYKVSVPEYCNDTLGKQISFIIYNDMTECSVVIHEYSETSQAIDYFDIVQLETLFIDDVNIYIFNFKDNDSAIEFIYNGYRYNFHAKDISYSDMIKIAKTLE